MANKDILVSCAFLATRDKTEKHLLSGKIEKNNMPGGFIFYLFELPSNIIHTKLIPKIINILSSTNIAPSNIELSFETLLEELNNALNNLAKNGDSDWVGSFNALIGFAYDGKIGITQTGTIAGYIIRKGKVSSILDSLKQYDPHPLKTFTDITFGRISHQDGLIFGNKNLFDKISLNNTRQIVSDSTSKEAISVLCDTFKKNKVFSVNAIVINASNKAIPFQDIPEVQYVDEPEETFLSMIKKQYQENYKVKLQSAFFGAKKKIVGLNKAMSAVVKKHVDLNKLKTQLPNQIVEKKKFSSIKANIRQKSHKSISKINFSILINIFKLLILPKNRTYLFVILILIFFLAGFLKLSSNNSDKSGEKKEQELALNLDVSREKYTKAQENIALGRTTDNISSLEEALSLARQAESSKENSDKAKELSSKIQQTIDGLSSTTRIYKDNNAINFSRDVKKIVLAGQNIVGLDENGKIYIMNPSDKEVRLVASIEKKISDINDLTYSDSDKKVYIMANDGKIIDFDTTTKTSGEVKADNGFGISTSIASYVTNLYLLDNSSGIIWKHTKKDTGFNKGSKYISNLKNSIDISIDGNIFILKGDGTVEKYVQGSQEDFNIKEIKGAKPKLISPIKISTDADSSLIYILDKESNRIVSFDKSGNFASQYSFEGGVIDDFVVNSKVQKMWLLSEGKIYEIKL